MPVRKWLSKMYSPKYAIETDRNIIDPVINENPFATID
jgi:hypothetical protein